MKTDIILCGVGGQGILSIATIIGEAAMNENLYIKQAEVHGMSQRGGDVQSNLRISSNPIASDLIPKGGADVIISMEPMEALRYLPFLSSEGWIITSSTPFINIPNYPDIEKLKSDLSQLKNVIMLDIEQAAKDNGVPRSANVILLGAAQKARRHWALSMRNLKTPFVASSVARAKPLSMPTSKPSPLVVRLRDKCCCRCF